jgi:DNA-binding LytR/AlgR family response regulator
MTKAIHKIYIVEDQGVTRTALESTLENAGYAISGSSATAEKAWIELQQSVTDLVLIDFGLKGTKNGAWLGYRIKEHLKIPFIYITAYGSEEFLDKIMKTKPAGYIMKPFNKPTLLSNIKIALENFTKKNTEPETEAFVFLKTKSGIMRFDQKDILYIKSEKNYLDIYTASNCFKTRDKLEDLLKEMNFKNLYRIHRRYAVNINHVTKIDVSEVKVGNATLAMSKSFDSEELIQDCLKNL